MAFKFNHKKSKLTEALGLSEKRFDEIVECYVEKKHLRSCTSRSHAIQLTLEDLNLEKPEELFLLGYIVAREMSADTVGGQFEMVMSRLHSVTKKTEQVDKAGKPIQKRTVN